MEQTEHLIRPCFSEKEIWKQEYLAKPYFSGNEIGQLEYLALLKAIRTCVENPYYKVGIFSKTIARAALVSQEAIDAIENDKDEISMMHYIRNELNRTIITFLNGSYMQFRRVNLGLRGCKFNTVLYDDDIDIGTVSWILCPMITKYKS